MSKDVSIDCGTGEAGGFTDIDFWRFAEDLEATFGPTLFGAGVRRILVENQQLRKTDAEKDLLIQRLGARIKAQSEILSKRAEK